MAKKGLRNWELLEPPSGPDLDPLPPEDLVRWYWRMAGQAIRRNRRVTRKTRAELAQLAGTEESLIEALELGEGQRDLPLSLFFRICAATGYDRCLLFSHPRAYVPDPEDQPSGGPANPGHAE